MTRCALPLASFCLLVATILAAPAHAAVDPALLAGMKARSIGPAGMSGRIAAVAGVPSDPNVIYVGAATGGLWKSTDGGLTFEPIFDDQPVNSIGAIAVDPRRPDVLWVGTGEGNLRNSVSIGNGMYKSLDGGRTWAYLGLPDSERIHRILLHPHDPDIAYLAVTGKLWGDSTERGVYKTVDGGATWKRILYLDPSTGCGDLAMDPSNPDKLIAAMYTFRRTPSFFTSGGPASGIHMTLDGGTTWRKLTPEDGIPEGELGRIGLAFAPSNASVVYAFVEAKKNVFLRSTDGGFTWKNTGAERSFGNRPFYYADIRVDPGDPNRVYSLWSLVSVSEDGGKTFRMLIPWSSLHPDHHAMWIDPADGRRIIEGNDGGVGISTDRGETWRFVSNLPLAQYYHIAVDMDVPYHVYGGMQDNGSWRGPNTVWENAGIRNHHWEEVGFGDGFDTLPYPKDSMQGYAMSQEGWVQRWNLRTGERRTIRPAAEPGDTLRFNWNAGIAQDPFDDDTIYFGSQYVHRSTDRGDTWTRISPDLTTDDAAGQRQRQSGGLTPDVTGAENYTSIIAIAPSALDRNVIWIGTDDGRVHVTRDGGGSWSSIESKASGVPKNTWVPHIDPSPHDAGTAFVVFDDHRRSNMTPYVFRVTDYGNRWTSLATKDLSGYCLVIEQDAVNPDLLFLGTEFGLFVSLDAGRAWMKWTHGVPTASVMDLVVHPREHDLVLGTHGRAAYVLDDIRPLRTLNGRPMITPMHLFDIPDAQQYRVKQTGASRFPGATEFRGTVRPYGALITFAVNDPDLPHPEEDAERARMEKKRAAGEPKKKDDDKPGPPGNRGPSKPKVHVTVKDAAGKTIRKFDRPVHQGVNRVVWDLRSDPFKRPPSSGSPWDEGGTGPEVLPGDYQVTVKVGEREAIGSVTVLPDPRFDIPRADREAAWEGYQRLGRVQETVAEAAKRIIDTTKDVDFVLEKIRRIERDEKDAKENEGGPVDEEDRADADDEDAEEDGENGDGGPYAELKKTAQAVKKGLKDLDKQLRRTPDAKGIPGDIRVTGTLGDARWPLYSTWDRPSPTALAYLAAAERHMEEFLVPYNRFFAEEVAGFRDAVAGSDLEILKVEEPLELEK